MGARRARKTTVVVDKKPAKRPIAKKTTASLTIHVVDSESRSLRGIHVAMKKGEVTVHEGFADKQGYIEFPNLTIGEDYRIFVNNEENEEIVGPTGDDEHEVEYDGEYVRNGRTDDSEEESEAEDDDSDDDEEDDVDLLRDEAEELET